MTLFSVFSLSVLGILLIIALINSFWGPFMKNAPTITDSPKVSVLIPARDEERNIGACLASLSAQNYSDYEILVLDDHSTDRTSEIVAEYSKQNNSIGRVYGAILPDGWTGKNWACHQLSQIATGDYLIFTDADTQHHPDVIRKTVGWMQHHKLGMFTAFPQQITTTLPEKLIVPLIELILYASLPLWLILKSGRTSLAAANGQWIAFSREAYYTLGGHVSVYSEIVEDIAFARLAKRLGIRVIGAAGTDILFTRMYHSHQEISEGLSKNLYGIFPRNSMGFFTVIIDIFALTVLPFLLLIITGFSLMLIIIVGMNLMLRLILAIRFRHPLAISLIFHPVAMTVLLLLAVRSYRLVRSHRAVWKGRKLVTESVTLKL